MLQALRFCISGAGEKMSDASRKAIMATLVGMLGNQEDATRTVASGCVGSLCKILPPEELTELMIQQLLGTGKNCVIVRLKLENGREGGYLHSIFRSPESLN